MVVGAGILPALQSPSGERVAATQSDNIDATRGQLINTIAMFLAFIAIFAVKLRWTPRQR
jgi:hypothetical protein